MEYNKKGPFIHLFQTPLGYYFYDVNTNQIIKINNELAGASTGNILISGRFM